MIPSLERFATHEHSQAPELWEGVRLAFAPCLGVTGDRLLDFSRFGNHATLTAMDVNTAWTNQSGRLAISYVGGGTDRVEGVAPFSLATFSQPFTWSAWIYVRAYRGSAATAPFTNTYFTAGNIGTSDFNTCAFILIGRQVNLLSSSTGSSWNLGDPVSGTGIGTTQIDAGVWAHIAITRSIGGVYTAWLNGKSDGSRTLTSNLRFNNSTLRIGCHYALNTTFDSDGFVDDMFIWDRQLSPDAMSQLYQLDRGGMFVPERRRPVVFDFGSSRRRRLLMMGQT